jgi:hypothetical protein
MVTPAFITGVTPSSLKKSRFAAGGVTVDVCVVDSAFATILPTKGSIVRLFITFLRFIIEFYRVKAFYM